MSASPDQQAPPGVVELREDVPLKTSGASSNAACGMAQCAGPRLILGAFAALSTAITLALVTQIYYGDYEVVPHGSVAGSGKSCSLAGTAALQAGGRAMDAAAAAALCLAASAPHRTGLDASGALLYWEYRTARAQGPLLMEWGGPTVAGGMGDASRPPRMVAALAALHMRFGVLPWARLLQPAIDIAKDGFPVSKALANAAAARGAPEYTLDPVRKDPTLAAYLQILQRNTSAELCAAWDCERIVRTQSAQSVAAGTWSVWAGGAGGRVAADALAATFPPPPAATPVAGEALARVVEVLRQGSLNVGTWPTGVASGLAVVDPQDTYAALVTGLSMPFGSELVSAGAGAKASGGWTRDVPHTPLNLAPAILVDPHVCGTRYVIGAESAAALAQSAAAALAGSAPADAVEAGRLSLSSEGSVALEVGRAPPPSALLAALQGAPLAAPLNATPPYASVNLVQQRGDALLSHADSRGGGVASRF